MPEHVDIIAGVIGHDGEIISLATGGEGSCRCSMWFMSPNGENFQIQMTKRDALRMVSEMLVQLIELDD